MYELLELAPFDGHPIPWSTSLSQAAQTVVCALAAEAAKRAMLAEKTEDLIMRLVVSVAETVLKSCLDQKSSRQARPWLSINPLIPVPSAEYRKQDPDAARNH